MNVEYLKYLSEHGIHLNERLGQHLLIDQEAIDLIAQQVNYGVKVIEIGAGPGNLTAPIAERANRVIGIEIDRSYEGPLRDVQEQAGNVEVVFTDALQFPFSRYIRESRQEWQIFGNIPYHISEPLLTKLVDLPVIDCVLTIGDNLAYLVQLDNPRDISFSKTSLLAQTFFEVDVLSTLKKDAFYPQPRTNSALVRFTPRERETFTNPKLAVQRQLFLTQVKNPTVEKVINNTLAMLASGEENTTSKKGRSRLARRALQSELKQIQRGGKPQEVMAEFEQPPGGRRSPILGISAEQIGLPGKILSFPFSRLDNKEVQILASALEVKFGR